MRGNLILAVYYTFVTSKAGLTKGGGQFKLGSRPLYIEC